MPRASIPDVRLDLPVAPGIDEYIAAVVHGGARAVAVRSSRSLWVPYESGSIVRFPGMSTDPIGPSDATRALLRTNAPVASYLARLTPQTPENATLYICRNHDYSFEKLSYSMRNKVRQGFEQLRLCCVPADVLLESGYAAYRDTRARNGLSDGSHTAFETRFTGWSRIPGHVFVGAWRGNELVAFLSLFQAGGWVEIQGTFAATDARQFRPNDALYYAVLREYLVHRNARAVSVGVSSIQQVGSTDGLHAFKLKAGFSAEPVHRAFVLHPVIRPLVSRPALELLNAAVRARPHDRRLRKAQGVMRALVDARRSSTVRRGSDESDSLT